MGTTAVEQQVKTLGTDERAEILAARIQREARSGWRVQAQMPLQATLVKGKPTSHLLHLVLTLVTLGLWSVVWVLVVIFAGAKSKVLSVDEQGRIRESK